MITAQDINKLRQQTGAGMMDCKKALIEAQGDFEKAIDILRKKGQKISAARADRTTTEGAVFAATNTEGNYGILAALSCETDFVAKNKAFQDLGTEILDVALAHQPTTKEELLELTIKGITLQEKITELIGKIGEKVTISTYKTLQSATVVPYIHMGSKLGVLVGLDGIQGDKVLEAGKDIAMQIAAMNPLALDQTGIDDASKERELAVAKDQARNEGKPEAMLDKIAEGRLAKFFKENTLLNQPFVKDNSLTITQYLAQIDAKLTITAFERCTVVAG